jgi:four helix bundle suffix protein
MSDLSDNHSDDSPLLPHGGYEKLRSYKVAEAVYDATVVFCDRFIDRRSRTHDQMVQAARSGVRNISEGSGAAATSRKSEMKLTNVARASLNDELLKDYKSYLIQNGMRVWPKDSPEAQAMRERLKHDLAPGLPPAKPGRPILTGLAGLSTLIREASPELAANAMLCAVNQAAYLLKRQLENQAREFTEKGGFTESLHATRSRARAAQGTSPDGPPCPLCGKATRRRTAGKGPKAGQEFWGCGAYPECRGILDIPSDPSDESDQSD